MCLAFGLVVANQHRPFIKHSSSRSPVQSGCTIDEGHFRIGQHRWKTEIKHCSKLRCKRSERLINAAGGDGDDGVNGRQGGSGGGMCDIDTIVGVHYNTLGGLGLGLGFGLEVGVGVGLGLGTSGTVK